MPNIELPTLANFGENAGVTQEEFDALAAEVDGLTSRISALEASDTTQDAELDALRTELADLQARLEAIEGLPWIAKKLP